MRKGKNTQKKTTRKTDDGAREGTAQTPSPSLHRYRPTILRHDMAECGAMLHYELHSFVRKGGLRPLVKLFVGVTRGRASRLDGDARGRQLVPRSFGLRNGS